jgi:hypothetical protein
MILPIVSNHSNPQFSLQLRNSRTAKSGIKIKSSLIQQRESRTLAIQREPSLIIVKNTRNNLNQSQTGLYMFLYIKISKYLSTIFFQGNLWGCNPLMKRV